MSEKNDIETVISNFKQAAQNEHSFFCDAKRKCYLEKALAQAIQNAGITCTQEEFEIHCHELDPLLFPKRNDFV